MTEFEKKLEQLEALEAALKDVELNDPEQQQVLEKFFDNMSRLRNMTRRFKQLEQQEEQLAEQVQKQVKDGLVDEKPALGETAAMAGVKHEIHSAIETIDLEDFDGSEGDENVEEESLDNDDEPGAEARQRRRTILLDQQQDEDEN